MRIWEVKLGDAILGYINSFNDKWWVKSPIFVKGTLMGTSTVASYNEAESFFRHKVPEIVRREVVLTLIVKGNPHE